MRAVTLYYHLPLYYYYYVSARRPRNRPYAYDTPREPLRTRSRAQCPDSILRSRLMKPRHGESPRGLRARHRRHTQPDPLTPDPRRDEVRSRRDKADAAERRIRTISPAVSPSAPVVSARARFPPSSVDDISAQSGSRRTNCGNP